MLSTNKAKMPRKRLYIITWILVTILSTGYPETLSQIVTIVAGNKTVVFNPVTTVSSACWCINFGLSDDHSKFKATSNTGVLKYTNPDPADAVNGMLVHLSSDCHCQYINPATSISVEGIEAKVIVLNIVPVELCSPTLTPPPNGYVTYINDSQGNQGANFSCDPGYHLSENLVLTCERESNEQFGQWKNTSLPSCEPILCEIPALPNGNVNVIESLVRNEAVDWGKLATFDCNAGYVLIGEMTQICQSGINTSGNWSGTPPQCEPIVCDEPTLKNGITSVNGSLVQNEPFGWNATVTSTCDAGYILIKPSKMLCQSINNRGSWSGPLPKCEPKTCPLLETCSLDISISYTDDSRVIGTEAIYMGSDGSEASIRKCDLGDDGAAKWVGELPDCCTPINTPVTYPAIGSPASVTGFSVGSMAVGVILTLILTLAVYYVACRRQTGRSLANSDISLTYAIGNTDTLERSCKKSTSDQGTDSKC